MATSPMVGGADPVILKSLETQTPSVARTAPATVSATTGTATSSGSTVTRGLAPQVSGGTVTYNQATQSTAGNNVTVTSSTSNDPGDVVTIYTSPKAVSVSSINQTVNTYNVNNYAGNEYTDSNVANYLPTFTGNVGAGNVNVTGTVYANGLSSTGLASLTTLNVSTTANLGAVGNVRITGGTNGYVLSTNGSGNLSWVAQSGGSGNGTPGGSNTQIQFNDAGSFGGNSSFTFDKTTGNIGITGNIIGSSTINIDNRDTGNNADINLYSADDITLQARDRATGSTAEGGDVNIYAGDSAEDSDTSAGDVIIEAGAGGASNIDFGGSGGFIRIEAGLGGAASTGVTGESARSGGALTLRAGDAGTNNGNIDRGNSGGFVYIEAGDTTSNGDSGGSIILTSGLGGANALAGQIQLIIPSSDVGSGGTWTFDGEGIIQLPNSGTIGNDGNNIDIGSTDAISLEASTVVNIYTDTGTAAYQWQFGDDGNLTLPGDIIGSANANFTIYSNAAAHQFVFGDDGTFYAPDNVVLGGNSIYIGPGANTLDGIEHEVFIASSNLFPYVQAVVNNISDNGSADWVALGARGGDTGGTASMGFTSSGFGDANYTITGGGDGYLFAQTYAPGTIITGDTGGNLVLATGNNGTVKDIIFGTGGFLIANTFGRISHANNSLELSRTGASLTFPDGSIQTTAYTGGGGGGGNSISDGNSNVSVVSTGGNVVIGVDNNAASWTFATDGIIYNKSEADYKVLVTDPNGDGYAVKHYVNDGTQDVTLTSLDESSFRIYTNLDGAGEEWRFQGNTLQVSTNSTIRGFDSGIVIESMYAGGNGTASLRSVSNVNDPNVFTTIDATTTGANITVYNGGSGVGPGYTWQFDNNGNLTLPGNIFSVNYANGDPVSLTGSVQTSIANGNSNVSVATANGNVTINSVGNTTMTITGTGANVTGTLTTTGKIGYASGSTVTQTTNRGNGVTINSLAGTVVTVPATMVAGQIDTFTVANDQVDPNNDIVLVQIVSPNFGVYNCIAQPSSTISVSLNGFYINIQNISGFTTSSDAITIRFMVIKAPNA